MFTELLKLIEEFNSKGLDGVDKKEMSWEELELAFNVKEKESQIFELLSYQKN